MKSSFRGHSNEGRQTTGTIISSHPGDSYGDHNRALNSSQHYRWEWEFHLQDGTFNYNNYLITQDRFYKLYFKSYKQDYNKIDRL